MPDRASLIEAHVIHEFDRSLAIDNLLGAYGRVMRVRYARMFAHLRGKRILDVGCGCGLFTRV